MSEPSVLYRMAHRHETATPAVPLTASRAVRLAATRAAEDSIGLTLDVDAVVEEAHELDALLATLPEGLLIRALDQAGAVRGLLACDFALCAAGVEVQTLHRVARTEPAARPITRADAALIAPYLSALLDGMKETARGTVLDGWLDGVGVGARIDSRRAAGFALADADYRVIRIEMTFGGTERSGRLWIALPQQMAAATPVRAAPVVADWSDAMRAAVLAAPACLKAVLHRFDMPLSVAMALAPGQVIALKGCNVGLVRLVAPDGRTVARARLGQVAGQIAVRIASEETPDLCDLPEPPRIGGDGPDMLQLAQEEEEVIEG